MKSMRIAGKFSLVALALVLIVSVVGSFSGVVRAAWSPPPQQDVQHELTYSEYSNYRQYTLTLTTYDSVRGQWKTYSTSWRDNLYQNNWDGVYNVINQNGVVAWLYSETDSSDGHKDWTLSFAVYDQRVGVWKTYSTTWQDRVYQNNWDGVWDFTNQGGEVAWLYSETDSYDGHKDRTLSCAVYDQAVGLWKAYSTTWQDRVYENNWDGVWDFINQDGVVAWLYSETDSYDGHKDRTLSCAVYDPGVGLWKEYSTTWQDRVYENNWDGVWDFINQDGVVAWLYSETDSYDGHKDRTLSCAVYDQAVGLWKTYSTTWQDLVYQNNWDGVSAFLSQDGVVAWLYGEHESYPGTRKEWTVGYAIYDPGRGSWKSGTSSWWDDYPFGFVSMSITNATVSYSHDGTTYTSGYNPGTGSWYNGPTKPLAWFVSSVTSGNPPLFAWFTDMSIGAASWSWNFGDGGTSSTRSPSHTFNGVGIYTVTLSVTGPGGSSSKSATIKTDTTAPSCSVNINSGAQYTNSVNATLTLSAADNSGSVSSMRFSNDGTSWSAWENYSTSKAWALSSGDGTKSVYCQVRDSAGNVSSTASDSIVLDSVAPSAPSPDDGIPGWSSNNTPTFSWSAPSDTSGIAGYYWNVDGGAASWTTSTSVTLPAQSDGVHTFYVEAKDDAGNLSSWGNHGFQIDSALPDALSPDDGVSGWSNNGTPTFSWSAPGDTSGIAGYYWEVDGGSETWTTWASVTLPPQSEGSHTFYVKAKDNAGNLSSWGTHAFQIDTVPPYTSGHSPAPGATDVAPDTSIVVHLQDTGCGVDIGTIVITVEGVVVVPSITGTATDYTLTYDPSVDFDGLQAVEVTIDASDLAGNSMVTDSYSFTIVAGGDTTPPSVPVLVSPTSWKKINNTYVLDWSDVSDPSGVTYQIRLYNSSWSLLQEKTGLTSSAYAVSSFGSLADGTYYWKVRAMDGVGNASAWTTSWAFKLDNTVPSVPAHQSPASWKKISSSATLDWSDVSDASGVTYQVRLYNSSWSLVKEKTGLTSSAYAVSSFGSLADGTYYWRVRVVDGAGNASAWTTSWAFKLDNTLPSLPVHLSPTSWKKINSSATLDWSDVSDPSGVTYQIRLYNSSWSLLKEKTGLTSSAYAVSSFGSLADGTYYWKVRAVDGAGNVSAWTTSWAFKLDNTLL
jgi:PKD repeat protein